jgi:hypothetical protein
VASCSCAGAGVENEATRKPADGLYFCILEALQTTLKLGNPNVSVRRLEQPGSTPQLSARRQNRLGRAREPSLGAAFPLAPP